MAFIKKNVFQRKSNASAIKLWNKILGAIQTASFYNWKHLRYWRDLRPLNLQLYWWIQARTWTAFETLAQIRLFSASSNTKNDSRFHSGNFSKGKAILLCESELWTSWLQHFPYVRIWLLLSYLYSVIIYVQNGFSVGNYSLKCSHFSWNK